jgi:hypothetical protein
MPLTTAQILLVRNDVIANPDLNAFPRSGDGYVGMATLYNLPAFPNWTVWKTSVTLAALGDAIDATELVGLTTGKLTQLQVLLGFGPINPSLTNRRAALDQIFSASGGTLTRPALLALYKRLATRIEKLLSTGTGSDVVPATLGFEGLLQAADLAAVFDV